MSLIIPPDKMFLAAQNRNITNTIPIDVLNESIQREEEVLRLMLCDNNSCVPHFNHLAWLLSQRYRIIGDTADLDAIIRFTGQAADLTPQGSRDRASQLNKLGVSLYERYIKRSISEDWSQAEIAFREAAIAAQRRIDRAINLHDLGILFGWRYKQQGSESDIYLAMLCLREAVRMDAGPEIKAICLMSLSNRHADKYYQNNELKYLDSSISLMLQANSDHNRFGDPDYLHNFGFRMADKYSLTGSIGYLNAAVSSTKLCIIKTQPQDPNRALYLNTLGKVLAKRSIEWNSMKDLDGAVKAAREAVDLTLRDHPNRAAYLSNLAEWLAARYTKTGAISDLDDAISLDKELVDLIPDTDPRRPAWLNKCGLRLMQRHSMKLAEGQKRGEQHIDVDDARRALALFERAVTSARADDPLRATFVGNQEYALRRISNNPVNPTQTPEDPSIERQSTA